MEYLNNKFDIPEHNSTLKTEVLAGITNYFTLVYLIILVPYILMDAFVGSKDTSGTLINNAVLYNGMLANDMLVLLTALSFICAGVSSIIMGCLTNLPFIQGPSLAVGSFISYTVCQHFGYTYNQALAVVFLSGICFFILAIFGMERKISNAIPLNIKYAVVCGVGLFVAYQGLLKGYILQPGSSGDILFSFTDLHHYKTKTALLAIFGVTLITILHKKHVHASIFIGKIACIILAVPLGLLSLSDIDFNYSITIVQDIFHFDFHGLLDFSSRPAFMTSLLTMLIVLFSICIMDIFETITMLMVADNFVALSDKKFIKKRIPQILEIDAITTSIGASMGCVTVSTYISSTAGLVEGGRTGFTSVVTGVLFLFSCFIAPLVALIPSAATATTLIISGVIMMNVMKYIDFENIEEAVPAFFTMILMPLTNNILIGISFGIISYVIIHIFLGKAHRVNKILYVISSLLLLCLIYLPR